MKDQYFKIGSVLGECYDETGPDGDVAWFHEDLTDGRDNPYSDIEYGVSREGFWATVKEHAAMMEAGDFPPECMD